MKADAVLWDYDGTLVNSVPKNIDITKQILSSVVPRLSGKNCRFILKVKGTIIQQIINQKIGRIYTSIIMALQKQKPYKPVLYGQYIN